LPTFYPAQVAFSVSKKQFKHATDRNLLKRRLREAYRHQKAALYTQLQANQLQMAFCFIYKTKEKASYEEICSRMEKLLTALLC
jgi:ribonuclease P protein component